ncbi:DUF262 domain-containing protein [Paenibacillus sp. GCM10027629]|uniref:DUF262 domain-containing protein n=1 Tax=Paenibacillus sp. GCM10027629 TaxID=3273414 RepID=UPI00362894EE
MIMKPGQLQRKLEELEEKLKHTSEPTYVFRPGDPVRVGNLQDAVVAEVLHDGKIYLIDYTYIDKNYGNPVHHEHTRNYYGWLDVRKPIPETSDTIIRNTDMNVRFTFRMLSELLQRVYNFGMNLDPDYQRDYVWELEDKVRLIDSVFSNVDIGKFSVIQRDPKTWVRSGQGYEIIDGKQRLMTLMAYYEDRFAWNGKKYSDLTSREQNHFMNYPIVFAEVKDMTREQTLRYFLMLNTVGKTMDAEHIDRVRAELKTLA